MIQPIKYWSTEVTAAKSASEILGILVHYRAQSTTVEWDSMKQPVSVRFVVVDGAHGNIPVIVRPRIEDVRLAVRKAGKTCDTERARRIAWRHLKDLIEQQMLSVFLGMHSMVEAFFANVEVDGDQTLGSWVTAALASGQVPRSKTGALLLPGITE